MLATISSRVKTLSAKLGLPDLARSFTHAILPPHCMHCLRAGNYLCDACRRNLRLDFTLTCIVCGATRPRGVTCRDCADATPLAGLQCLGSYHAAWLRRGIHWLKFKAILPVAPMLAELLASRLLTVAPLPELRARAVLIPIPLHAKRLRERGFNQSLAIARHLGQILQIPVADILIRTKATQAQAKLPAEFRSQNVAGAFALKAPLPRSKSLIIIVDDVATSGATLESAARTLKATRQNKIWGLTLARG